MSSPLSLSHLHVDTSAVASDVKTAARIAPGVQPQMAYMGTPLESSRAELKRTTNIVSLTDILPLCRCAVPTWRRVFWTSDAILDQITCVMD